MRNSIKLKSKLINAIYEHPNNENITLLNLINCSNYSLLVYLRNLKAGVVYSNRFFL